MSSVWLEERQENLAHISCSSLASSAHLAVMEWRDCREERRAAGYCSHSAGREGDVSTSKVSLWKARPG